MRWIIYLKNITLPTLLPCRASNGLTACERKQPIRAEESLTQLSIMSVTACELQANYQTRQRWSNMNEDSVTVSPNWTKSKFSMFHTELLLNKVFEITVKAIFTGRGSSLFTRSWDIGDSWASHRAPVNRQHTDVPRCRNTHETNPPFGRPSLPGNN